MRGSRPCWPCCLNKPSTSPLSLRRERRPYARSTFPSARPSELTVGQHYPSLTTRSSTVACAVFIFVEEIMKKRLRHRVRVISILFAVAIALLRSQWRPGGTKLVSLRQFTTCNCSQRTLLVLPFSFSIGHGIVWFCGSICSCVKFHSDGRISLRLNIARVRRVTSSPG